MNIAQRIAEIAAADTPDAKLEEHDQVRSAERSTSVDINLDGIWFRVSGDSSSIDRLFMAVIGDDMFNTFSADHEVIASDTLRTVRGQDLTITELAPGAQIEPQH